MPQGQGVILTIYRHTKAALYTRHNGGFHHKICLGSFGTHSLQCSGLLQDPRSCGTNDGR